MNVTLHQLGGGSEEVSVPQEPTKPEEGQEEIVLDGMTYSLEDIPYISLSLDDPGIGNPWWDVNVVFVDGLDEVFVVHEQPTDPFPLPPGWIELTDQSGNKVWVQTDLVQSAAPGQ